MSSRFQTISVIGLGYIGLPTAAAFASRKVRVIGVDVNATAVDIINKGKVHIIEPELDLIVSAVVSEGYLRATTTPEPADAFLIAVPTPFQEGHVPDLTYVKAAAESVAKVLVPGNLVILESTSPVGTTEQMAKWMSAARPDLTFPHQAGQASDIRVAHCPERVLPGYVMQELVRNDRVIGGLTPACSEAACALYRIFIKGECIFTDARTAEMCKLSENAFRDVNIAFANELSLICDKLDISVWELIRVANRHPRVNILQPGPGVGGHCIAVDPWFIVNSAPEQAKLIRAAREINDGKADWVVAKVSEEVAALVRNGKKASDIKIACFGLTFKPDIDDVRESPAMAIAESLLQTYQQNVFLVEPYIMTVPEKLEKYGAKLVSAPEAITQSDIIVLLVDHSMFKAKDIRQAIAGKSIVDTRGIWV